MRAANYLQHSPFRELKKREQRSAYGGTKKTEIDGNTRRPFRHINEKRGGGKHRVNNIPKIKIPPTFFRYTILDFVQANPRAYGLWTKYIIAYDERYNDTSVCSRHVRNTYERYITRPYRRPLSGHVKFCRTRTLGRPGRPTETTATFSTKSTTTRNRKKLPAARVRHR